MGNSSSGLTEAPSFRLPVVNIGDRQRGRVRAPNVIDVPCSRAAILTGNQAGNLPAFSGLACAPCAIRTTAFTTGSASERIKDVLKHVPLRDDLLKKSFHDLPLSH